MNYNTVWISDLHLGTRGCNGTGLLDFLRESSFRRLYLVGDVVDLWRLRRDHYWPQSHNDVVQKILRKARKGTQVIWIPGNHDEFCRNFWGIYGNVVVKDFDLYKAVDGRRLLVMHGHEFDAVTTCARWLAYLGDRGYSLLLSANRPLNALRTGCGLGYWSLSRYVKARVKRAVSFVSDYEDAVARYAQMHRADGIVCGHIHTPAVRRIRNVDYYNTGDWVESSTALVEHLDGRMELVRWQEEPAALPPPVQPVEPAELTAAAVV
jgi:UDP-2,3-diacylglucosamine pyrophosphatase LpxH